MTKRDRIRCTALLCCHCVRNVAYYRAGWRNGELLTNIDFWVNANGNFLDVAVLEWCKVFVEKDGRHHWKKVIPDPNDFLVNMLAAAEITEETFNEERRCLRKYRNKFVAHLDQLAVMGVDPELTLRNARK